MKKRVPAFFTGALSAVLMCAIVSTALAVGGTLAYNGFNVAIFGEQKVAVGENFETESGTQAPSTITYIDETGAGTNYISLRLMAQLLGANVVWDGSNKTVDFAATSSGNFEIIQGGMPGYKNMTTVPTLGTTAGPFTEVAPQQEKRKVYVHLDQAEFCSRTGFINQLYHFRSELGNHAEIQIRNHGAPVGVYVERPILLSANAAVERFEPVRLETGETLLRTFAMDETDVELERLLKFNIVALGGMEHETDITVTITQYFS